MTVKLTAAQRELLATLKIRTHQQVVRNYKPALKLSQYGFATIDNVEPPYGWKVTITDAGRAVLAAATKEG